MWKCIFNLGAKWVSRHGFIATLEDDRAFQPVALTFEIKLASEVWKYKKIPVTGTNHSFASISEFKGGAQLDFEITTSAWLSVKQGAG